MAQRLTKLLNVSTETRFLQPIQKKTKLQVRIAAARKAWRTRKRMAEARARPASTVEPAGA